MLLDILFLGAHHIYYTSFDNYEWYDGRGSYILLDSRNRSIINDRAQVQNTGSVWWNEQIRLPGKITKNHMNYYMKENVFILTEGDSDSQKIYAL